MNQEPLKSVENFDDFLNMKYNNFGSDIKQEGKEDKFERNKDDTLDITIFRDLGSKKNENFFNKAGLFLKTSKFLMQIRIKITLLFIFSHHSLKHIKLIFSSSKKLKNFY